MKKLEKLQKQRKELTTQLRTQAETVELLEAHQLELESNPLYSLEVDPENKYNLSTFHKDFIKYYIEFKNIPLASDLAGIDLELGKSLFVAYSTQEEIKRINKALYQRQFNAKMLTLDQIGGYLTSLITDENVPISDRLKSNEKLRVIQMIIDLLKFRNEAIDDPSLITNRNIESQVKSLSIETIRKLLYLQKSDEVLKDKKDLIDKIDIDKILTDEEIAYLQTLTTEELLQLVNSTVNGGHHEK